MKRLFSWMLLGSALLLPLAACSPSPEAPAPADPPAEVPAEDGEGNAEEAGEATP